MKLLIISNQARSGKDTLAEIWADEYGFTYKSSSLAAAEIFIYEKLKDKYNYSSIEECWNARLDPKMRIIWYDLITEYNREDRTKLAKEILRSCDGYIGMRNPEEIIKAKNTKLFDLIIFVDAGNRVPIESTKSNGITVDMADIVIRNVGTLEEFKTKALKLGEMIFTDSYVSTGSPKKVMELPRRIRELAIPLHDPTWHPDAPAIETCTLLMSFDWNSTMVPDENLPFPIPYTAWASASNGRYNDFWKYISAVNTD